MKPPLSIDEQINLLMERGLIADYGQLKETLNHISYYKLSGYFYIYQDKTTNQFDSDTDFRDIINLYNFDQELRKILLGYLHIIEISLASQISNHFCNRFQTSTPYLDNNIFYSDDKSKFDEFLCSVKRKINISKHHEFIKHNLNKYKNLPLWVLMEILDFGNLFYIYGGLPKDIALDIAKTYNVDNIEYLASILESLRILRNKSAHNNRVYNSSNYPSMYLSKNANTILNRNLSLYFMPRKVFFIMTVMKYILDIIKPNNNFKYEIDKIITDYEVDVKYMGVKVDVIPNWKDAAIWSV